LEEAIGLGAGVGTTAGGSACFTPGSGGCYNGIITLNDPTDLAILTSGQGYYYGTGPQPANDYDIFSVIEHETDEVLGTSSCIDTGGGSLSDGCAGSTNASAVDLFRYSAPGTRVLESTTPGAYFSDNGGATAIGPDYNTLANGNDYADFVTNSSTNCVEVQTTNGCLGAAPDISTDGGSEVTILDAVGYNLKPTSTGPVVPEPNTLALLGSGMLGVGFLVRRRRTLAA